METEPRIALRLASDSARAEEWALVLAAEGLSPSVRRVREGFALTVPADEAARAAASLSAYERENAERQDQGDEPAGSANLGAGLVVAAALLAFYLVTSASDPAMPWYERGSAHAERILRGELWRTVTALTLHADLVHGVTNSVACVIFLSALCGPLGAGLGCSLFLLAGAVGNLANAVFHGPFHNSVGASTAIFGAVGLLGALGVVRRKRTGARGRRAWLPVAAGFAILALLGTGSPRVDYWAHLFGFLAGAGLGILVPFAVHRPPTPAAQWSLGGAGLTAVLLCWLLALR